MMILETENDLLNLIKNEIQECTNLEYKAGDGLQKSSSAKNEISKDVSAMANAAGGIIIYGIMEKQHKPESITPIDPNEYSKEWLEQVIQSNIQPKIEGLIILPITVNNGAGVAYVVKIPQDFTAHQASTKKYYKRHNFSAEPMDDYEIRDIMNRVKNPIIEMGFVIEKERIHDNNPPHFKFNHKLTIFLVNKGNVYAKYINYVLEIPTDFLHKSVERNLNRTLEGNIEFWGDNIRHHSNFNPILPGLKEPSREIRLIEHPGLNEREIVWTVHADNSQPRKGSIKLHEIHVNEK